MFFSDSNAVHYIRLAPPVLLLERWLGALFHPIEPTVWAAPLTPINPILLSEQPSRPWDEHF